MLRFADTRRFDIELKQLISANAYHLIQNPEKSKYLPKVGSFSETDFQLFNLNCGSSDLDEQLASFEFRKAFVTSLLKQLSCIYISSPNDMAYAFVLSGQHLLCAFQYSA